MRIARGSRLVLGRRAGRFCRRGKRNELVGNAVLGYKDRTVGVAGSRRAWLYECCTVGIEDRRVDKTYERRLDVVYYYGLDDIQVMMLDILDMQWTKQKLR